MFVRSFVRSFVHSFLIKSQYPFESLFQNKTITINKLSISLKLILSHLNQNQIEVITTNFNKWNRKWDIELYTNTILLNVSDKKAHSIYCCVNNI